MRRMDKQEKAQRDLLLEENARLRQRVADLERERDAMLDLLVSDFRKNRGADPRAA